MHNRLLLPALIAALLVVSSASEAQGDSRSCNYVAVEMGEVAKGEPEIVSGPALAAALLQHPDCEVVAVNMVCRPTEMMKNNVRYFYDTKQRVLVFMERTVIKVGDDYYTWRIWYDVVPADFAERLPYGREDIATKPSPWNDPKTHLLLEYKGPEAATEWP
jgi:hypothetical protein